MLSSIANILADIGNFFSSIVSFITKLFSDLVYVVQLIGETVAEIPSYFSWLPASVVAAIVALFAIVVIYKVLGRD